MGKLKGVPYLLKMHTEICSLNRGDEMIWEGERDRVIDETRLVNGLLIIEIG